MLGCGVANGLWLGEAAVEGKKVALQNMTKTWPLCQSIGEGIKLLGRTLSCWMHALLLPSYAVY
jgi:hypothetical protein